MASSDRLRWDARYSERADHPKGPDPLLVRHTPPAQPGSRALELACGLGRNALWLAEQGYRVEAIDISLEALRRARAEMIRRGVTGITWIAADLDHFPLPRCSYDLVVVFRFLDRQLFPAIRKRVRPGGLVIYETLNRGVLKVRPNTCADYLLEPGELASYFPGWTVIEAWDGPQSSAFVGQKPDI